MTNLLSLRTTFSSTLFKWSLSGSSYTHIPRQGVKLVPHYVNIPGYDNTYHNQVSQLFNCKWQATSSCDYAILAPPFI